MSKAKVLVTGSDGFIGTHLVKSLKEADYEVVEFQGDILKPEEVEAFFANHSGIEKIIHLVGLFGGSFADLVSLNAVGTHLLLESARKAGVKKVVYTSTGAVYGEPVGERSKETDPITPNTDYGLSKKIAEEVINYAVDQGMKAVILRFPNVYGPGSTKGVIYHFVHNAKEKHTVVINGDGNQSRDFLHVDDAVRALVMALEYDKTDTFNISYPEKISLNLLAERLKTEYEFTIQHQPADNDLQDLLLDVTKAKQVLGFEAQKGLDFSGIA